MIEIEQKFISINISFSISKVFLSQQNSVNKFNKPKI